MISKNLECQDIFTGRLLTGGTPTWKGKHGNSSYSEWIKEVLIYNFTSLAAVNAEIDDKEIFLLPSGFCKILTIDPSKTAGNYHYFWSRKKKKCTHSYYFSIQNRLPITLVK